MKRITSDKICRINVYLIAWAATSSVGFIYILFLRGTCDVDNSKFLPPSPKRIQNFDVSNVTTTTASVTTTKKLQVRKVTKSYKSTTWTTRSNKPTAGLSGNKSCLPDYQVNTLIGKCKERGVRHLLFIGDSRTQHLMFLFGRLINGSVCLRGASSNEKYKDAHYNYHCTGSDGLKVDYWWSYRLNDSLVDIFRNTSSTFRLNNNMKRPDAVLFTTGLHNLYALDDPLSRYSLRFMNEVEDNLTEFVSVMSDWENSTVFYMQQTPILRNNKNKITSFYVNVLNVIAKSTLENFPRIHYMGELWDIVQQSGGYERDGLHCDEATNRCLLQKILTELCCIT